MKNPKIYTKLLGSLAGFNDQRIRDIVNDRSNLNQDEEKTLRNVVQKLRVDIKNALDGAGYNLPRQKRLFAIASDPRLKKNAIFGTVGGKLTKSALTRDRYTFDRLSTEEYQIIENGLAILMLETSTY